MQWQQDDKQPMACFPAKTGLHCMLKCQLCRQRRQSKLAAQHVVSAPLPWAPLPPGSCGGTGWPGRAPRQSRCAGSACQLSPAGGAWAYRLPGVPPPQRAAAPGTQPCTGVQVGGGSQWYITSISRCPFLKPAAHNGVTSPTTARLNQFPHSSSVQHPSAVPTGRGTPRFPPAQRLLASAPAQPATCGRKTQTLHARLVHQHSLL